MSENKEKPRTEKKLFKNDAESESLKNELAECKVTTQEWKEKYTRLSADLVNYNKRMEKEKLLWSQVVKADVIMPLLAIIDDFDRAKEKEQVSEGINMIHAALYDFLKKAGVQEVSYEQFNPELHEALMQVESDDKESGSIVQVMQKGYALGDKVLRPAKVSVAK